MYLIRIRIHKTGATRCYECIRAIWINVFYNKFNWWMDEHVNSTHLRRTIHEHISTHEMTENPLWTPHTYARKLTKDMTISATVAACRRDVLRMFCNRYSRLDTIAHVTLYIGNVIIRKKNGIRSIRMMAACVPWCDTHRMNDTNIIILLVWQTICLPPANRPRPSPAL